MELSKKAKRRLGVLISFMEKLPRAANKHFDMSHWFAHNGEHSIGAKEVTQKVLTDCGTSACALGWACTIPSFRKAGLRMPLNDISSTYVYADAFFDADSDLIERLFTMEVTTPKQWAKAAKRAIKLHESNDEY